MPMTVKLTDDLESFVRSQIQSGGYADADDVIRDALRHLRDQQSPLDIDSPELEVLLLAAEDSRAARFDRGMLKAIRDRAVAEQVVHER